MAGIWQRAVMTSEQWQRVKAVVAEALAAEPAARDELVERACGADQTLRREVLSLLTSIDLAADRFEGPLIDTPGAGAALRALIDAESTDAGADVMIGRRIGPYEIRCELGRGGMGAVYLASRVDEFTQEVALKIIKRGMDTDAIVRRFRTERQILAGLDHPNIARLLDGGTTPDGLPYIVMEYVDGEPITTYCDVHTVGIAERLALVRSVVDAVGYAHQHLVIHRDIKPSNVLVTRDGRPKLLDFGLATVLTPDQPLDTNTADRWMTPDFASPEQVRGGRVTTATDVFSLGVLLYELLCGRRPFSRTPGSGPAWTRAIAEEVADRPSVALMNAPRDSPGSRPVADAISAVRATTTPRLRRRLRGDLDTIALKALDPDPARRYGVAQELSEDIHRHLVRLPIAARADTFVYRATRFVRRHTAAAAAVALVATTLVGATIVTTEQARIARQERERAERRFKDVRQLASSFLFDFHDAIATLPGSTAAREMVVKTAQQYLDSLTLEAGTDHELLLELSTAYLRLADVQGRPSASRTGDTDGALKNYEQALALRRRLVALEPSNVEFAHSLAIALVRMGPIFEVRGDPRSAIDRTREGLAIMDRLIVQAPGPEIRRDAFRAPLYLGDALADAGDYAQALAMYRKALGIAETARRDPPEADFRHRLAVINERVGTMFMVRGEYPHALDSYREALANEESMRAAEPDNAGYVRLMANGHYHVADALTAEKNYREATNEGRRALEIYEGLAAADPKNVGARKDLAGCMHKLAETLLASGDWQGAGTLLRRAVSIQRDLAARDAGSVEYREDLADSLMLQGESQLAGGQAADAIASLDEARGIRAPLVAARPQQVGYRRALAQLYTDLGDAHLRAVAGTAADEQRRQAAHWYQEALALWRDVERQHALWSSERDKASEVTRRLAECDRGPQRG
jgi:serine/threonine protein kinase